jgi:hypothetical protein
MRQPKISDFTVPAVLDDATMQRAVKRIKGRIAWEKIASMRELQCIIRVPLHPSIVRLPL